MIRSLSLFCLLVIVPLAPAAPVDSAVHVDRDSGTGWSNAGSGTVVAAEGKQSLILTAAHVVPDGGKLLIVTLKGKSYVASYLAGSAVKEIKTGPNSAILEIDGPDLAVLTVGEELPAVKVGKGPVKGMRVRQWAFANRTALEAPFLKTGTIDDPEVLFADLDARPGDSGGGLFNDDDELVSVTSARPFKEEEKGVYGVPNSKVRNFLSSRVVGFPKLKASVKDK